ncbi:DEAD/DEAH box helicase [Dechloromonas sp. ZY10]|uniref:DEAD/DEAH box helicase n=1 Tax=Dechloromonas aquae TaxID=2664436 RepID=UPI003526CBEE
MSFTSLGLLPELQQTLHHLDYRQPTLVQQQAIPAILAGRDLLASAATGSGKTAAFALPLLQRLAGQHERAALILVPTRELAEQVADACTAYARNLDLACVAVYGGVPLAEQVETLSDGCDLLVATPGRLLDLLANEILDLSAIDHVVLDEADRLLALGFARELATIGEQLPDHCQRLLFSATFPPAIRRLAQDWLRQPLEISATPHNRPAPKIKQWVVPVDKKRKPGLLLFMLRDRGWRQALIFVKSRKGADDLVTYLRGKELAADALHGERDQETRREVLAAFRERRVDLLVATDVAARGLDIDDLPLVINFDLPLAAEDYVHRIGRSGRAGASGTAVSLVCADEAPQLAAIERLLQRRLSREEEPGFEPRHELPQAAPVKPGKPTKTADFHGRPAAAGKTPGHPGGIKRARPGPAARPGAPGNKLTGRTTTGGRPRGR